ncbi:DUF4349 domain-containing protein [Sporosalibacterium faouarense]|uniref:DUF4349 domain-containing protein n=1 Tax=Sporosalibacterium faouarense TaxID=516123 RepID=UPI00141D081F|nr:DUF4349 domain-containing protein [Sporosalibacterium faouarense]MTI48568.1 DUF4349 domain-containing protein [Bacillota bacterium]
MDCRDFDEKISLYIDNQLDNIEKKEFELHLLECDECRKEYDEMIKILKFTGETEEEELPENYKLSLRSKLEKEKKKEKSKVLNWRVLSTVAAALFVVVVSYGFIINNFGINNINQQSMDDAAPEIGKDYSGDVGNSQEQMNKSMKFTAKAKDSQNMTLTSDKDLANGEFTESLRNGDLSIENAGKKIIKSGQINLESTEFDVTYDSIINNVKNNNGYIESSGTSFYGHIKADDGEQLRSGNVFLRVPEEKFYSTLDFIKSLGEVKSQQLNERDISESYLDTENYIKNLEVQEKRLREILEKANNVDEILRVENELRRVRTEIDNNNQTLKNWDSLVNYSSITVNILEVKDENQVIKLDDEGLLLKGKKGFISTINKLINFVENTLVFLMTIAPVLIIIAIILILALIFIRRHLKQKQ